ncbi:MAG: methyltransferase domain-containing protein [Bacteroidales bacterium]|nr:methyltransferase domain-containing protein [Bacteroidales bacterium]
MNSIKNFVNRLASIDTAASSMTDYCRVSLNRTLNAAEYYVEIYHNSLEKCLELASLSPEEMTIVDYGGGHGLLSAYAKSLGFGRVVYVDINPEAVRMAEQLFEMIGLRPDDIITGDVPQLIEWCHTSGVTPNALVSIDVIEHIYVLDDFFGAIHSLSPQMKMVFTTASTPYNSRVVRNLHKAMQADELGTTTRKGFWQKRRDYIQTVWDDMSERELDYWADNTRGLTYDDVKRAVESRSPNLLCDDYNTCDPATGSWTERILPEEDYRQLLLPYGWSLDVKPGHYNVHRRGLKAIASRRNNKVISMAPTNSPRGFRQRRRYKRALSVAPFIYLMVS